MKKIPLVLEEEEQRRSIIQKKPELLEMEASYITSSDSSVSSAVKSKIIETCISELPKLSSSKMNVDRKASSFNPQSFHQPLANGKQIVSENVDIPSTNDRHLSKSYFYTRNATKDLPSFSGKPKEWPLFISAFENSTRECN